MGMHLIGSKAGAFVAGVITTQLYKSGIINKVANKAIDGVESVIGSDAIQKIRNVGSEGKKTTKKSTSKS